MTEADRYVNDELRPLAEKVEALYYQILTATSGWQNAALVDDETEYAAERAENGIPAVKGSECYALKDLLLALKTAVESEGVMDSIVSLRVRPPRIS